jgi:pseudouridine-5'-phosphate glycosidase
MPPHLLDLRPVVTDALRQNVAVVALESTLIAHGLPWPQNLETARAAEAAVRGSGAIPATIAVLAGKPTIGLDADELESLARASGVRKASTRDLGAAIAAGATAATTVAATMRLAHLAGLRVFATGGIGGVHPSRDGTSWDVSADLVELGRTPVAVVCAGAKSILDLSATLEMLETQGVPVVGFATDTFPAFYLRTSGLPVSARVDSPRETAAVLAAHWRLTSSGAVVAQPLPQRVAFEPDEFARLLRQAEEQARREGIRGAALTPYLLSQLARLTTGRTLTANHELIVANAQLAGLIANDLHREAQ